VKRAYVDRGYRGHQLDGPTQVFVSHTRGIVSPTIRRELRRRNAIEPVIGHLKSDGLDGMSVVLRGWSALTLARMS